MDARSALREARAKAAEADERLIVLRDMHAAAKAFASTCTREVEGLAAIGHDVALDRADAIRRAIEHGAIPMFQPLPEVSANAAQMAEAQSRLDACRLALQGIEGDLASAEAEVMRLRDEAAVAVTSVMIAEAAAIAERILSLESEAVLLRARMGGPLSPITQLRGVRLPEAVVSVLAGNDRIDALIGDPRLSSEAARASKVWTAFVEALAGDPDAELSFEQPAIDARAA